MKHKKNFSLPALPSSFSSPFPRPTSSFPPSPFYEKALTLYEKENAQPIGRGPDFVELLGRSGFSFLMGASHPEEMVLRAKTLGYRGLAL